jgi:hypothetical protein
MISRRRGGGACEDNRVREFYRETEGRPQRKKSTDWGGDYHYPPKDPQNDIRYLTLAAFTFAIQNTFGGFRGGMIYSPL